MGCRTGRTTTTTAPPSRPLHHRRHHRHPAPAPHEPCHLCRLERQRGSSRNEEARAVYNVCDVVQLLWCLLRALQLRRGNTTWEMLGWRGRVRPHAGIGHERKFAITVRTLRAAPHRAIFARQFVRACGQEALSWRPVDPCACFSPELAEFASRTRSLASRQRLEAASCSAKAACE